ncbi:MAG: 2-oxoacid:acceptor oxidoreductase subunit alpha [Emcibacter sp.]|nr:2-oxoacid:acceptor oxidoreductase subunit alpha [Emcibacter sp.]HEC00167.1 2-oxoacid:acceptor oxidoreductase subunit alpha [Sphingomonadales bacterium]
MTLQSSGQETINLQGNHACALGAVAAGCRFYAGYPITPSSEVAERLAKELPKVGGVFLQMEDEIASIAATLGASMGGVKAMTATSGPGFSLKQENLGYGMGAEIPCVVVNVMRGGPSTGMPTRPAQGDLMQARWGTHGDHPVIALTPGSVEEIYQQTARAFALSEKLRIPVIVLFDESLGHLVETVALPDVTDYEKTVRKWATGKPEDYKPYKADKDGVPPMARPGDGYRVHTTGLTVDESGWPTQKSAEVEPVMKRLLGKVALNNDLVESFEDMDCEDAEVVVVALGVVGRAARKAVRELRASGVKAGLFRPITLWPFPTKSFRKLTKKAKHFVVAEMNAGQLILEIGAAKTGRQSVTGLNRFDGVPISPSQIKQSVKEVLGHE